MAITLILLPGASLVGAMIGSGLATAHDNLAASNSEVETGRRAIPNRSAVSDLLLYSALVAVPFVLAFIKESIRYALLGFLLTLVISRLSVRSDLFVRSFPNGGVRFALIFLFVMVPFLAYYKGASESEQIRDTSTGKIVDLARSQIARSLRQPVFYMGMLGSTHVLYEDRTHSVIFVPAADDRILVVTPGYRQ